MDALGEPRETGFDPLRGANWFRGGNAKTVGAVRTLSSKPFRVQDGATQIRKRYLVDRQSP